MRSLCLEAGGLMLGFAGALGVFGLGEAIWAMSADADPGCDPTGSAACGVFVQASHPLSQGETR